LFGDGKRVGKRITIQVQENWGGSEKKNIKRVVCCEVGKEGKTAGWVAQFGFFLWASKPEKRWERGREKTYVSWCKAKGCQQQGGIFCVNGVWC